jgi:hypothetical protein
MGSTCEAEQEKEYRGMGLDDGCCNSFGIYHDGVPMIMF